MATYVLRTGWNTITNEWKIDISAATKDNLDLAKKQRKGEIWNGIKLETIEIL